MVEDSRTAAERRLAEEEEARRNTRLLDLEAEELQRREEVAKAKELEEKQAAAREDAERREEEIREMVEEIQEDMRGARRKIEAYVELYGKYRRAKGAAGDPVPDFDPKAAVGNFIGGELGPVVGPINSVRSDGSPTLAERDPLCPKN